MNVTARRHRVQQMIAAGWKHREVAAELGITMRTVGRDATAVLPDPSPEPVAPEGGACRDADPDSFFAESGNASDALAICLQCPVLQRCAAFAVGCDTFNTYGVIGGLTANDRREFRAGRATVSELHDANRARLGIGDEA